MALEFLQASKEEQGLRRQLSSPGALFDPFYEQNIPSFTEGLRIHARIERPTLHRKKVDLLVLVLQALDDLRVETRDRVIHWKIGDLPVVKTDPELAFIAIAQLVSNAVKFTRSRHPAIVEIAGEPRDDGEVLFVRDNGVGFDPRFSRRVFRIFERLHANDGYEGEGIGLAIAARAVERLGGRVWAGAVPDVGAEFRIFFPTKAGDQTS